MDESFKNKYALQMAASLAAKSPKAPSLTVAKETAWSAILVLLAGTNNWANPDVTEELFTLPGI